MGVNTCAMWVCCKNLGCGRLMCEDHSSKKRCWPGANQYGCYHRVCTEHEKPIKRKLRCYCAMWFVIIFALLAINLGLRAYFGQFGGGEDHEDHEE